MSNVTYLVFENSTNVLNMNKINVFKNGSEMPWTYYQADILADAGSNAGGRNRLMYTSESKPGPNGEKAGKYASQIKRFINFGNASTFQEQTINAPKLADYKSWGWKLASDPMTGEEKLPEFGEFAFKPGMEPSYEDLSAMNVEFKFGFGLNNTCYNFATETAAIQVYNLSCKPKVYCTTNKFCEISYNSADGSFGPDITEQNEDGTITCSIKEGVADATTNADSYAYLLVCVESGEQLDVSFNNEGTELEKNQITLQRVEDNYGTPYTDNQQGLPTLSQPYRSNVSGDSTLGVTGGIKYDFYRLRLSAATGFQSLKYNSEDLNVSLKLTPKTYGTSLTSFSTIVNVNLKLTKDAVVPGIRSATTAAEGFKMTSDNNQGQLRARLVVTNKEAINYGIKNNSGPSFIRGKTAEEALAFYQRSMLTETEKNLDDYKQSFNTPEMKEKLAHFYVTDLSAIHAQENSGNGDVDNVLAQDDLEACFNKLKTDLAAVPTSDTMPLSKLYEKSDRTELFQKVRNLFNFVPVTVNDNGSDTDSNIDNLNKLWADSSHNTKREFGVLGVGDADLISNKTTSIALLYAINNYNKTGSDPLINKYINRINEEQATVANTPGTLTLAQLELVMNREYHGIQKIATSINGPSKNRPSGLYDELYGYRCQLNPLDANGAKKYLQEIIEIQDVSGQDTKYYGSDELYKKNNLLPRKAGEDEIKDLLYEGDLATNIIASAKLFDTDLFNTGLSLTSLVFVNGVTSADNHAVFYTDLDASASTGINGQFKGNNSYQFAKTLDALRADVSNSSLEGKWVLSNDGVMATGYNSAQWHPENCDLSGLIRLPNAKDGCYWDFTVNGKEVKETLVDVENHTDLSGLLSHWSATDTSANNYYKKNPNLNNLIDNTSADALLKYSWVQDGVFKFFRIGEIVKFFVNVEDLDAEADPAMAFPSFKITERGDTTGECQLEINDAYIPLKDVESTLNIAINLDRSYGAGYDISNNSTHTGHTTDHLVAWYHQTGAASASYDSDASGIYSSRWSTLCVPIDMNGELERGETFTLSLGDEKYRGDGTVADVSAGYRGFGTYASMFADVSSAVPDSCADARFNIEYQNSGETEWANANGVVFEYECHQKPGKSLSTTHNSDGVSTSDPSGDAGVFTTSSNIKGMPRFRVCLPPQNKLISYYNNNSSSTTSTEEHWKAIGREVALNLKYNKSAKRTSSGALDIDGNNKTEKIFVIISNDEYDANISTTGLTYDEEGVITKGQTRLIKKIGTTSDTYLTGYAQAAAASVVGPGVKEGPSGQQQCVPDYSKLQVYDIQSTYYDGLGSNNQRSIDTREVEFKENNHGISNPIATINAANFMMANGEYSCTAEIVPLFKYDADEKDYQSNGTYCNIANNKPVSANDALAAAPRLIPANTNYGIYSSNNGTKFNLYRINNLNYEEWVGGSGDIYTYNNFYNSSTNKAYREIVSVKLTYHTPTNGQLIGVRKEQQINFLVEPKDVAELHYPKNFHFNVTEGDKSVDITSILSATLEGKSSSDIKYYIRGGADQSGDIYIHTDKKAETSVAAFIANADASNIEDTYNGTSSDNDLSGHIQGLTFNTSDAYGANSNDITCNGERDTDLTDKLINGKLMLYHSAHATAASSNNNPHFDAYTRKEYRFLVVAKYEGNNQSGVENTLSMVTITVQPGDTGFYLANNATWAHNVVETLGTESEGKGLSGNNPSIPLSTFTSGLRHEDIGAGELHNVDNITMRVAQLDSALEIVQGVDGDFKNQIIRLKNTSSNKTTETETSPSTKLADYPHYNYERQKEYNVTLEVCISKYYEICVEKVTNYVCGVGEITGLNTNVVGGRTCSYLMKKADNLTLFGTNGPDAGSNNGKLYYFQDAETGLYQGPLSVVPTTLEQTQAKRKIGGVSYKDAFVRYDQSTEHVALYKTADFRNDLVKAPKPTDSCLQPFTIKVLNSFDKPKVSPQPYMIAGKTSAYCTADPLTQTLLDNELITANNKANSVISYVYTDHHEFRQNNDKDLPSDFKIPNWHPTYSATGTNETTPIARTIHSACKMSDTNTTYNNGLYNGSSNGKANGSYRYGKYNESDASDTVILDYFIEYHDRIDASGYNEISPFEADNVPFGAKLTYVNSVDMSSNGTSVTDSEYRMIGLGNVCRGRQHLTDGSDNYYTTGEIAMTANAKSEKTYQFTVVAVSNVKATTNDLSYNVNMVDYNQSFYPKIAIKPDGSAADTINGTNYTEAQPFQKYVYDLSGERIVTYGYASVTTEENGVDDTAESEGALLCCRTHFTVCVTTAGTGTTTTITANSGNYKASTTIDSSAASLKFDGGVANGTLQSDGTVTPGELLNAVDGDIRLFNVGNGQIIMAQYNKKTWSSLNQ